MYGGNTGHVTDYLNFILKENFVPLLNKGSSYINFIHVKDVARLYYLIHEKNGSGIYHGTDNVYITANELNHEIGKHLNVEIRDYDLNEAYKKYGFFALGSTIDQKLITKRAHELKWNLKYPSFIGCLDKVVTEVTN